jgi:hypothetical protein
VLHSPSRRIFRSSVRIIISPKRPLLVSAFSQHGLGFLTRNMAWPVSTLAWRHTALAADNDSRTRDAACNVTSKNVLLTVRTPFDPP